MEKGVLRNFEKFTGKHLCQSLFFKTFFHRAPLVAASDYRFLLILNSLTRVFLLLILVLKTVILYNICGRLFWRTIGETPEIFDANVNKV